VPKGSDDGWILVVDGKNEPQGWLNVDELRPDESVVGDQMLHRGGTLARQGGSLRSALDAALSSPTGRGVIVDGDGRLIGSISAGEVLALIEQRQPEPQP
jgi:osmoprotectant transport system ATP-binding protein